MIYLNWIELAWISLTPIEFMEWNTRVITSNYGCNYLQAQFKANPFLLKPYVDE